MISFLRRAVRFTTSAWFVSAVLGFITLWSIAATIVPQGDPTFGRALRWAEANPAIAPMAEAVGLHQAFTGTVFQVVVGLLALSTVLCSWQRTKVAIKRSRALRDAARLGASELAESHDTLIELAPGIDGARALSVAEDELRQLGFRTRSSGGALSSVSSWIAPWGSPVFHWALVGIMLFVLIGSLVRSDGLIGLAVGEVKPDAPQSYGRLDEGPWHSWDGVARSFRLDDFEPRFTAGGIDRGPVPTVSILDAEGNVLKTQPVYPNKMLHLGSLSVSAPAYGLAVHLSLEDTSGVEIGRAAQLVDFDQTAPDGTIPLGAVPVFGESGATVALVHATVPLVAENGQFVEWLPKDSPARLVVMRPDDTVMSDSLVSQGETVEVPEDMVLRVVDVGWYSRLSILDDWTIPFIYGCMVLAVLALSVTVFTRQQFVLVAPVDRGASAALAVRMRLWRHAPATRTDIVNALTRALSGEGDERE